MVRSILFLLKEILKEAQAIQAKQDNILRLLQKTDNGFLSQMSFKMTVDPLSGKPVVWEPYKLEDGSLVRVRRSGNELPPETGALHKEI